MEEQYEEQDVAKNFQMDPGSKEIHSDDNFRLDSNAHAFSQAALPNVSMPATHGSGSIYAGGGVAAEADYGAIAKGTAEAWKEAGEGIGGIDKDAFQADMDKRRAAGDARKAARKERRNTDNINIGSGTTYYV